MSTSSLIRPSYQMRATIFFPIRLSPGLLPVLGLMWNSTYDALHLTAALLDVVHLSQQKILRQTFGGAVPNFLALQTYIKVRFHYFLCV